MRHHARTRTCHLVECGEALRNAHVRHADLPQHLQLVLFLGRRLNEEGIFKGFWVDREGSGVEALFL